MPRAEVSVTITETAQFRRFVTFAEGVRDLVAERPWDASLRALLEDLEHDLREMR